MYLEPIQTSNMKIFVKMVNILMPLTILTKSFILLDTTFDWILKTPKASIKAFVSPTFLALAATWLNTFFPFSL